MSRDLNLKKSWHPGLLKNQEIVWKREKEALEERKKIAERQKEIERERERDDLLAMQGGGKRVRKLEWMYGDPAGMSTRDEAEAEDYLLGKKRIDISTLQEKGDFERLQGNDERFKKHDDPGDNGVVVSERQLQSRIKDDPMFMIKQKQMEAAQDRMRERGSSGQQKYSGSRSRRESERYSSSLDARDDRYSRSGGRSSHDERVDRYSSSNRDREYRSSKSNRDADDRYWSRGHEKDDSYSSQTKSHNSSSQRHRDRHGDEKRRERRDSDYNPDRHRHRDRERTGDSYGMRRNSVSPDRRHSRSRQSEERPRDKRVYYESKFKDDRYKDERSRTSSHRRSSFEDTHHLEATSKESQNRHQHKLESVDSTREARLAEMMRSAQDIEKERSRKLEEAQLQEEQEHLQEEQARKNNVKAGGQSSFLRNVNRKIMESYDA